MTGASRPRILIELCIASVDDAIVAQAGGADRLELNSGLGLGGLTPSLGTLIEVKRAVDLPVIAMIRPRPGGFAYADADVRVMARDASLLLREGAEGLAFGFLKSDGTIDEDRCKRLLSLVPEGCASVFHRAFDVTPDPFRALDTLIALGFTRVLTSGQAASAPAGAGLIARLIRHSAGRIEILPGAGVHADTVETLIAATGCDQVHGSLRSTIADDSTRCRPSIQFGARTNPPEQQFDATDLARVQALRERLSGIEMRNNDYLETR